MRRPAAKRWGHTQGPGTFYGTPDLNRLQGGKPELPLSAPRSPATLLHSCWAAGNFKLLARWDKRKTISSCLCQAHCTASRAASQCSRLKPCISCCRVITGFLFLHLIDQSSRQSQRLPTAEDLVCRQGLSSPAFCQLFPTLSRPSSSRDMAGESDGTETKKRKRNRAGGRQQHVRAPTATPAVPVDLPLPEGCVEIDGSMLEGGASSMLLAGSLRRTSNTLASAIDGVHVKASLRL